MYQTDTPIEEKIRELVIELSEKERDAPNWYQEAKAEVIEEAITWGRLRGYQEAVMQMIRQHGSSL
jgi:hypothetical protein